MTGLGPIPWAVNSEIYPLWARGTCSAISGAVNWTMSLVVSSTFLTLTEVITKYGKSILEDDHGVCKIAIRHNKLNYEC